MRRLGLLSLFLVVLLAQAGCSTSRLERLPEKVRGQLGPVAVVSARFAPTTELRMPAEGGAAGAGRGAAIGALVGMALVAGAGNWCKGYHCIVVVPLILVT